MALAERFQDFHVARVLAHRATESPSAPFLLLDDASRSFSEIDDLSEALAASISNLGVGAGDRIALILPSWPSSQLPCLRPPSSARSSYR